MVSALASRLKVPGLIPGAGKGISISEHAFLCVICRDDMKVVHHPSNREVKWSLPV